MTEKQKLLLIDGNSITFRGFYALFMQTERFVNHDGLHTSAVFSFKRMLDKILDDVNPDKILVAFDAGKKTFRTVITRPAEKRRQKNCRNSFLMSRSFLTATESNIMN